MNTQNLKPKFFAPGVVLAVILFSMSCILPLTALAASNDPTSEDFQLVPTTCGKGKPSSGQAYGPTQDGSNLYLDNECGWEDLLVLIDTIVKFILWSTAIIGTLSFCYAGFLYVTAFGESGKIEQAHGIFSATITGVIIIFIAWLVVATILKVLEVNPDFSILDFADVKTIQK